MTQRLPQLGDTIESEPMVCWPNEGKRLRVRLDTVDAVEYACELVLAGKWRVAENKDEVNASPITEYRRGTVSR